MSNLATEIKRARSTYAGKSPSINDQHARFEALVSPHIAVLTRVAYRICSTRESAEDVVQESLLRAWRHLDRLKDPKAIKGWLFMILRNERNRAFRKLPPLGVDIDLEALASPQVDSDIDDLKLRCKVGALPEKYRTPLSLYAFEGYQINEISQTLGIKDATVKTRLFRAREKLRADIEVREFFG